MNYDYADGVNLCLCLWYNWQYFTHITLFLLCCFLFMPPLKKGAYCFATVGQSVCRSVGLSVCRPSVVHSISFDPLTLSIPNLLQGLPSISRWSLLIFRSHVQRSRSNHSSQPTVLSTQYLFTPSLDQYQTCCRCCPQWVDDHYWFSGHMFKVQGQTTLLSPVFKVIWWFRNSSFFAIWSW